EGFVDVGEHGCQLCSHAVPGAELDRVEHTEGGDADARIGGGGGPGSRTEEATAELRRRPDGEGEEGADAEQPEVGTDPDACARGLGELVRDLRGAAAEVDKGLAACEADEQPDMHEHGRCDPTGGEETILPTFTH